MNKLDILNRGEFVEQLLNLIKNISGSNSSACFAINGAWGSGKSFVLDILQEELEKIQSESTMMDKFFVIRYNCWKYDYYEEPLIAIVSSLLSSIDEKIRLFPDAKKTREVQGVLKAAGEILLSIGSTALKNKAGVDIQQAYEIIKTGKNDGAEAYAKENEYDIYFSFKKIMEKLSGVLQKLAEEQTVIFLVDELDRCLPEYAVKVLERLHHLTEERNNIITIISIDKEQLMSSIKQIFGFDNPEKYLEKFINFEVKLDYGIVSEQVVEKYSDYVSMFDKDLFQFEDSVEECLQAIFRDIDIRSQEQLMKKASFAHKLLYSDKKDYTFMCMEILLAVMICIYHYDPYLFENSSVEVKPWEYVFLTVEKTPKFSEFFKQKFEKINFRSGMSPSGESTAYVLPEQPSLYAAILLMWYWMHKRKGGIIIQIGNHSIYDPVYKNINELKKYVEMLEMIN